MRINLKKMKKILFAVISFIVVVLISVASNNRNSNIQDVSLLLKNVEDLTAGEEGGASGSCQKSVPSIMRADCDGDGKFESTFAIITTYSCEGDGSGPCKSGTVSTTYDCEGYVTGYSDLTLDMNC